MLPRLVYAINAIVLGYVLNIASIALNYADAEKDGIALALVSFIAAYFSELSYVHGTNYPIITRILQYVSIAACALSLAVWYF